jgi:hypothetical protein
MNAEAHQPAPTEPESVEIETARVSTGRRVLFVGVLFVLALAPFACGEVILRWYGYGGYPNVLQEVGTVDGLTYVTTFQGGVDTFFSQTGAAGQIGQIAFVTPKPPNTRRIFILGGSAAKGYPQPPGLSWSAFLQAMLRDAAPDGADVEVLNLATTAVASFPLTYYIDEVLRYAPDVVVVYTGNNEFFGAGGVASVHSWGTSSRSMHIMRWLRGSALVQWAGVRWAEATAATDPDAAQKTLMERVIADGAIAPDDPRRRQALENLPVERSRDRGGLSRAGCTRLDLHRTGQ